jgi:addiction module antidote protein HigA|nr:HigA family addiction module antitoxin [Streptococcus oralis]
MVNMTNKIVEYKDLIAFHPGQYLGEFIEDFEMTKKEFAERLGISEMKLGKLVNGEESISNDIAENLAKLTNISMQTWLNLQNSYDVKMAEFLEQSWYNVKYE